MQQNFVDQSNCGVEVLTSFQISQLHEVNINGGSFTNVRGDYNHNVIQHQHLNYDAGIHFLYQHIAENGLHDASERYPAPNCHLGTREEVLKIIKAWISDSESETDLLWLSGRVGTGKSAIMQAIVNELLGKDSDDHPIVASFFFGRGKGKRALGRYLFPTLSYQLALNISELRGPINYIMHTDPSLPTRSIETQFQSLIVDPFDACRGQNITPKVIMIDGLDECDQDGIQQLIVELVGSARNIHQLPLRFVISSRPEHQICEVLDRPARFRGLRRVVLDNFEASKDIEKYLRESFAEIYQRKSYLMRHVSPLWPEDFTISQLVDNARGQFIYASTVVKFTDNKYSPPDKQLEIVLDSARNSFALSPLDNLYTQILSGHPEPEILITILGYLVLFSPTPLHNISISLSLDSIAIQITLQLLQSLLVDTSRGLVFAHASFREYLSNRDRSGKYFINKSIHLVKFMSHTFSIIL